MKINKFNKQNLGGVREVLEAALKDVATLLGVNIEIGSGTFKAHQVKFNLVLQTLTETGENQQDKKNFAYYALRYGFVAEDFGTIFITRDGKKFKIAGWNRRRWKNPIDATLIADGSSWIFPPNVVLRALGKPGVAK